MPNGSNNAPRGGTGPFLAGYVIGRHAGQRVAAGCGCLGALLKLVLVGYGVVWIVHHFFFC